MRALLVLALAGALFAPASICPAAAQTNPVVRDHRGTMGSPQGGVSVEQGKSKKRPKVVGAHGPLGGPKNKGGFAGTQGSGGKGGTDTGPTIRDHRKGN